MAMKGCKESKDGLTDDAFFGASQYAFFGKDAVEEVELGGLEDDEGGLGGLDEEYHLSSIGDREEGDVLGVSSDIDDITATYSKLNKVVIGSKSPGVIGDRGSCSRESSAVTDLTQEAELSNWLDHNVLDTENVQEGNGWWSQPHTSSAWQEESKSLYRASSSPWQPEQQSNEPTHMLAEYKSLYRTSSYPQQPPQHFSDPIRVPQSSFTSQTLPDGRSQVSPYHTSTPSALNLSPFCGSPQHLAGLPYNSHCGGNVAQLSPSGLPIGGQPPNHWLNQASRFEGENSNRLSNLKQQQLPYYANGFTPSQLFCLQQQQRMQQRQPSLSNLSRSQPQLFSPHTSPKQMMNTFDPILEMADQRIKRLTSSERGRKNMQLSQQASDSSRQTNDSGLPQFRSKYMSADEIEGILRMQHAATNNNDPYIDDYYHQACLAKTPFAPSLKHEFCPTLIKDLSSRGRTNNEPPAYPQVDALGRLPFSLIRRPRPLLEVDLPSSFVVGILGQLSSMKPLDQEPMLAARIMIEDGLCVLLDVDDIDRMLQSSHLQDGGSQLRRRRQVLLDGIAESLQLVDPLGPNKSGNSVGLSPKDDLVFLWVVSIPKGRKLLCRFLKLLLPGSELVRIVCMAIFRHLRFLFGILPSDSYGADTITYLAKTVSFCVCSMDLNALSACLAAIVCSLEQPPLRPLGSLAGDGASMIIKSVLEKATVLFTMRDTSSNYNMPNRALWQASFDAFFGLLTKYCLSKYDTLFQKLLMESPSSAIIGSEAARDISKEMPIEVLRASLPHADDHQRKMLHDFTPRSMPTTAYSCHAGNYGLASESVPG